jgi:hypothetical protein
MAKRKPVQEILDVKGRIDELTVRQVRISEQLKELREKLEGLMDSGITPEEVQTEVKRLDAKKNAAENLLAEIA